jgi:hypothetical protein
MGAILELTSYAATPVGMVAIIVLGAAAYFAAQKKSAHKKKTRHTGISPIRRVCIITLVASLSRRKPNERRNRRPRPTR